MGKAKIDPLTEVGRRHGIDDLREFFSSPEADRRFKPANPEFFHSREEVEEGFAKLRWL